MFSLRAASRDESPTLPFGCDGIVHTVDLLSSNDSDSVAGTAQTTRGIDPDPGPGELLKGM